MGNSGANPGCGPTGTSPPRYSIAAARTDAFPVLWFGAMKARACLVPINTRLAPPEVVGILRDSGATHLVVGHEFAGIIDASPRMSAGIAAAVLGGAEASRRVTLPASGGDGWRPAQHYAVAARRLRLQLRLPGAMSGGGRVIWCSRRFDAPIRHAARRLGIRSIEPADRGSAHHHAIG